MVKDSNIFDIDTPALLIDLYGVEKNLDTMQKKAMHPARCFVRISRLAKFPNWRGLKSDWVPWG
jgi:hypothetical protein